MNPKCLHLLTGQVTGATVTGSAALNVEQLSIYGRLGVRAGGGGRGVIVSHRVWRSEQPEYSIHQDQVSKVLPLSSIIEFAAPAYCNPRSQYLVLRDICDICVVLLLRRRV